MKLTQIKLAGFKSFVDVTKLDFLSNLTAIVGPNGCGKSNIIDAVRWVLGESSAKYLRGEAMEDVIFSGTKDRPPVAQASIELRFSNEDGRLGGQYASYSEIVIKRQVDRSAQSVYYLNGSRCRRRDIADIFLGTGLGPRSYAVIEQGVISQLVEAKPDELRTVIEEAAGVSKYKERKKETERRIERTRDNLSRVLDIENTISEQLERLKKQVVVAERYQRLKQQEMQSQQYYQVVRWYNLDNERSREQQKLTEFVTDIEGLQAELTHKQTRIEEIQQQFDQAQDDLQRSEQEVFQQRSELTRLEQQLIQQQELVQHLNKNYQYVEQQRLEGINDLEHEYSKLNQYKTATESLQITYAAQTEQVNRAEQAVQAHIDEEQAWQQRWDDFRQQRNKMQQQTEVLRSKIMYREESFAKLQKQLARLTQDHSELPELELITKQLQDAETQKRNLVIQIDIDQQKQQELESDLKQNRVAYTELQQKLQQQRALEQQLLGQRASLNTLQQAVLTPKNDELNWLQKNDLTTAQQLLTQIQVTSPWEYALEVVLSRLLKSVLVPPKIQNFEYWLTELRTLSRGRLTLILTPEDAITGENIQQPSHNFPLPPLMRFVIAGKFNTLIARLLNSIYAAEHYEQIIQLRSQLPATASMITPEGLWCGNQWLSITNQAKPSKRQQQEAVSGSLLVRQRELSKIEQELKKITYIIAQLLEQQQQQQQRVVQLEEAQQQCLQKNQQLLRQQAECLAEVRSLEVSLSHTKQQQQQLTTAIAEARQQQQEERKHLLQNRNELQQAIDALAADVAMEMKLEEEKNNYRKNYQQLQEHFKSLQQQQALTQKELQQNQVEWVSCQRLCERFEVQQKEFVAQAKKIQQELTETKAPIELWQQQRDELLGHLHQAETITKDFLQRLNQTKENLQQEQQSIQVKQKKLHLLQGELSQKKLAVGALETKVQVFFEQLQLELNRIETILSELPHQDEQEFLREVDSVRNKIKRLGAINLAAIDEYDALKQRHQYLEEQRQDLNQALETLTETIVKIDREIKSQFKSTFDRVNAGFGDLFPKIFGGGIAKLQLQEEDLLTTGIGIMAQPPGKRNTTIHLLSGGEKALTAIALVFSLFQLNPAPFCLLDEVDAPLDDANVTRFSKLVREMSRRVQFIMVTHNKIAMEVAEQLIGITMQEQGISKIVAVDVKNALELAEVES